MAILTVMPRINKKFPILVNRPLYGILKQRQTAHVNAHEVCNVTNISISVTISATKQTGCFTLFCMFEALCVCFCCQSLL